ncbi:MAG: aldo/keto reductase, partial [Fimbriimonadales bacterium]
LSGKYLMGMDEGRYATGDPQNRVNDASTGVVRGLKAIADEMGVPLITFCLAWVLNQPGVTSAIIGVRKLEQFDELIKATELEVGEDVMKKVDEVIAPGTHVVAYYDANFGPNALPM